MARSLKPKSFLGVFARQGLAIIITAAILLEATAFLQFYFSRKGIEQEATRRAESELENTEAEISGIMSQVEVAVKNNLWAVRKMLPHPDSLYDITQRILDFNPSVSGSAVAMIPDYYRSCGRLYSPYSYRNAEGEIASKQLGTDTYDYTAMEWFTEALTHPDGYWSEPYFDEGGGEMLMSTFSMPVYDPKGRTVAVLTADMSLDWLSAVVDDIDVYPGAYSLMVSRSGQMMVAQAETLVMRSNIQHVIEEIADKDSVSDALSRSMLSGERGRGTIHRGRSESEVFFAPIQKTGWSMAIVVPHHEIYGNVEKVGSLVALLQIIGLILLVMIIRQTAISMLKLRDVEERKEVIERELQVARNIQMSMLPKTFPPFPDRHDLDLYGVIIPAKEVGGDLYDFFIRGDYLCFCIGDVSGKGVPASLVMAMTRSLFRTASAHENCPDRIIGNMNDTMSEMNESSMFVTCFVGILDLTSGQFRYCNAGHNAPIIISTGGARALDVASNIPLGIETDMKFEAQEATLRSGESLLLYTDGLTEAENEDSKLYGDAALLKVAGTIGGLSAEEQVDKIEESVRAHVAGAPQSDDLTILNIRYLGAPDATSDRHLVLHNDIQQIPQLAGFVETIASESGMPQGMAMSVNLALEEAVTNVIMYAYPKGKEGLVEVEAIIRKGEVEFIISDSGQPFDPTSRADVDTSLSVEDRPIGGLGIHLVRKIMDEVSYARVSGRNVLRLIKKTQA